MISKLIKDCLTGLNGEDYDPARVYGAMAVLAYVGLEVFAVVVRTQQFEPAQFAGGFAALLAGFGLGVKFKSHTEEGQS